MYAYFKYFSTFFLFTIFLSNIYSFSGSGSGTDLNPFEITTCSQLQEMKNNLTASYELTTTIGCSGVTNFTRVGYCGGGSCTAGGDDEPFSGNFYGGGNTISDLSIINLTTTDVGWGLFGFVNNSNISDVTLENVFIDISTNYVGGLIGIGLENSNISNVYFSGDVTGMAFVGSLAGSLLSFSSLTSSSVSSSEVSGTGSVGGMVGTVSSSSVINSSFDGSVYGTSSAIGGLVGFGISSTINKSFSSGFVSGNSGVGGLAGNLFTSFLILNSYSNSSVVSNGTVGGLVGGSSGTIITNSYSFGLVTGTSLSSTAGGLIGGNSAGSITNSFSLSNVSGVGNLGGIIGGSTGGTFTNIYWNNNSNNPDSAFSSGIFGGVTPIDDNLSYFYDNTNPPLNSWDPSIWDFSSGGLPFLVGQENPFSTPSSSSTGTSSLFPSYGIMSIVLVLSMLFLFFR